MATRKLSRRAAATRSAKNMVRGALSDKNLDLIKVVSKAAASVPTQELDAFAAWISIHASSRARVHPPATIKTYADLFPQRGIVISDLLNAMQWSAHFLSKHLDTLKDFIGRRETFERACFSGDHAVGLAVLDGLEADLGLSIWLIQAKLALLHRARGLEAQKEYARSIHDASPSSIPSFTAHYTSQRCEDSTSFDRFSLRIRSQIDKQPVSDAVKTFLRNRLIGKRVALVSEIDLSGSLSVSSSSSVIDGYEALIDTAQLILERPDLVAFVPALRAISMYLPVPDWRVVKLQVATTRNFGLGPFRSTGAEDAMIQGAPDTALQLAFDQAERDPFDVESLAVAAECCLFLKRDPEEHRLPQLQAETLTLLHALRSNRGSLAKTTNDICKFIQNMRALRVMDALHGYYAVAAFEQPQFGTSDATAIFCSSPYITTTHWAFLPTHLSIALTSYSCRVAPDSVSSRLSLSQSLNVEVQAAEASPEMTCKMDLDRALYHRESDNAVRIVKTLLDLRPDFWYRVGAKIDLHHQLIKGEMAKAIDSIAKYCCERDDLREVVPLRTILSGQKWKDVKHLRQNISLPIIFDLYWRTVDESEHATTRRIAYDEFLKANGCGRPSDLMPLADRFDLPHLIYFLAFVAVPEVMDVSFDVFTTSRQIQEERLAICSILSDLDSSRGPLYAAELKSITTDLTVQDGLRDVDRSRVHVNTEAVARWAEKELLEDFIRYKDLRRIGIGLGSPEEFQSALSRLTQGDTEPMEDLLRYPQQEGDELLINLINGIKTDYLTNSDYGLDAYLSMRIRHGSLQGHMRGPLEEHQLIVAKDGTPGKYQENLIWATKLGLHSESERNCFFGAFRNFSGRYDEIIEDLTKNRLQIKSSEKSSGMFSVSFEEMPLALHFIRNAIDENTSFSDFVSSVFSAIDILLGLKLVAVRNHILECVKPAVGEAFEALRSSLEKGISLTAYTTINSALADVIPELQAAVHRIAEWFVPVEKQEAAVRTFEEVVNIGIEVTRKAHRGFAPRIDADIERIGIQTVALSDFTDILFTVLDNVYCHSGNRVSPWVKLRVWTEALHLPLRIVKIRIESETVPGVVTEAAKRKLERIRDVMASGDYRKQVNLEGGTGLLKLKRLVSIDPRHVLDFGFVDESSFFVDIHLVLPFITHEGD